MCDMSQRGNRPGQMPQEKGGAGPNSNQHAGRIRVSRGNPIRMTSWGGGGPWNPGVGWTEAGMGVEGLGREGTEQVSTQGAGDQAASARVSPKHQNRHKNMSPHAGDSASWRPVQPFPHS